MTTSHRSSARDFGTSRSTRDEESGFLLGAAVIPYIEQPVLHLGSVTLAAFGTIVAVSVLTGFRIGARRFQALGLDPTFGEGMAWWVVTGGFIGAHLFAVVFYFPGKLLADPLILFKLWEDISSFGGILGGAFALALYLRVRGQALDASQLWAYADVAAFAFPISLMIGRAACALAHDHPGAITSFPLAVSLAAPDAQAFISRIYAAAGRFAELPPPDVLALLGFHDLGWYEFLYLVTVVVPLIVIVSALERRRGVHRPGTYLILFMATYLPVRFALDFLRVSDVRYVGLTPAQWTAAAALGALPVVAHKVRDIAPVMLAHRAGGSHG